MADEQTAQKEAPPAAAAEGKEADAATSAALTAAIREGDEEQFKRALSLGAAGNTTTTVEKGEFDSLSSGDVSALMLAIEVGCTRTAQRLLERALLPRGGLADLDRRAAEVRVDGAAGSLGRERTIRRSFVVP